MEDKVKSDALSSDPSLFNDLIDRANSSYANLLFKNSHTKHWPTELALNKRSVLSAEIIGDKSIVFTCNKTGKKFNVQFSSKNKIDMFNEIDAAILIFSDTLL